MSMKRSKFELSNFVPVKSIEETAYDLVEREKKLRKSRKITQRDLARRSGVSYASIRRFETTGEISFRSLLSIANALGCLDDFDSAFKEPPLTDLRELFK